VTREEAIQQFKNVSFDCNRKDNEKILLLNNAITIINEIYGNFENRVCENCKHCFNSYFGLPGYFCGNDRTKSILGRYPVVDKDFGCNRFEPKENE